MRRSENTEWQKFRQTELYQAQNDQVKHYISMAFMDLNFEFGKTLCKVGLFGISVSTVVGFYFPEYKLPLIVIGLVSLVLLIMGMAIYSDLQDFMDSIRHLAVNKNPSMTVEYKNGSLIFQVDGTTKVFDNVNRAEIVTWLL